MPSSHSPPSSRSPPSPLPDYSSWTPWSISTIAFVCFVFLLLSNYRILKRLYRILTGRPRVQFEGNPNDPSPEIPIHGLEASTISLLPITQFKKNEESESMTPSINTECAVCLGEFEEGDLIKNLPNCNHSFHSSCIDAWFRDHSSCPLCRSPVLSVSIDCPNSEPSSTMAETLGRDEVRARRVAHYQTLRAQNLQSSELRTPIQGADQRN